MQDEIQARLWNAHHEAFSNDVAAAADKAAASARRFNRAVPMPLKLLAAVLAVGAATLTATVPAFAAPPLETRATVQVPYGDLNLGSVTGRQALDNRIEGAARRLCRPDIVAPLIERADRRACYIGAVASARGQIDRAVAAHDAGARTVTIAAR